ncbi:MAG TPA: 5-oxoprolinase subunit PxpB [Vicinamibacterales bacterium]|nr:5-oxoprolinase subunit PxpB [Vicinamibacterales bacterium]
MIVRSCGDTMLLVEWEQVIDPVINQRAIGLAARLEARLGPLVRDIVPGYCSLGIHFDPLLTDIAALERTIDEEARELRDVDATADRSVIEIPVRYGGTEGPDLENVAEWAGCTAAQVVERHASRTYRVYMLGFVPGFAYMGRVDSSIAAPRHRVPRERVAAGSVGIAGEQTGVYPIATPGGWRLVGQTDAVMFDAARATPNLLRPGDLVRFVPVTRGR